MIKSMTGFASLTREGAALSVSVTARSVNHRYLDLQVHLPPSLPGLEARAREEAQRRLARGRVELRIAVRRHARPPVTVEVDEALVAALVEAAARPDVERATGGRWTVGDLLRFPRVVTVTEQAVEPGDDPEVAPAVLAALGEALDALDSMRAREGGYLRADLDARLAAFGGLIDGIEQSAASAAEALGQRLTERLAEIEADVAADPAALAREVVRFTARSDISEEVTRLRAHIEHWTTLADGSEPCGRKLDFLLQEMNREVNTIGSKADGHETSGLVVAAKAELEKLREQIQNVE